MGEEEEGKVELKRLLRPMHLKGDASSSTIELRFDDPAVLVGRVTGVD